MENPEYFDLMSAWAVKDIATPYFIFIETFTVKLWEIAIIAYFGEYWNDSSGFNCGPWFCILGGT